MKKAFYLVIVLMTAMVVLNVSAQMNTLDRIAGCGQDTIDEWVVDSIEDWIVDTVEADTVEMDCTAADSVFYGDIDVLDDLELSDCELTDRYGLIVTGSKYGIRDHEKKENVTDVIYDYAYPAFRRKMADEYYTYFYIYQGEGNGILAIIESTNEVMTIISPTESETP